MNRVIDNWIPVEFFCRCGDSRVAASYHGRVCKNTGTTIIVIDNEELVLVLSNRQRADAWKQIEKIGNSDIIAIVLQQRSSNDE